jgi:hypothetical protein
MADCMFGERQGRQNYACWVVSIFWRLKMATFYFSLRFFVYQFSGGTLHALSFLSTSLTKLLQNIYLIFSKRIKLPIQLKGLQERWLAGAVH